MANLLLPLYSWGNGAFIMIAIFAIVILGLVGAVMLMMNSDKKKKNDQYSGRFLFVIQLRDYCLINFLVDFPSSVSIVKK